MISTISQQLTRRNMMLQAQTVKWTGWCRNSRSYANLSQIACAPTHAAMRAIALDVVKDREGRMRGKIVRYHRKY